MRECSWVTRDVICSYCPHSIDSPGPGVSAASDHCGAMPKWGNNNSATGTLTNDLLHTLAIPSLQVSCLRRPSRLHHWNLPISLHEYKKKTKNDFEDHELAAQLENCTFPSAILAVLDEQCHVQQVLFDLRTTTRGFNNGSTQLQMSIRAFPATISGTVGLICRTPIDHLHP